MPSLDQNQQYRRTLRISVVVMAAVLLFQSGLIDERSTLVFEYTTSYLVASVGATASVAPTELNTITAGLAAQKQLLSEREAALRAREVALTENRSGTDYTTYILAAILFVQLVLLVLNYGLDYLRAREQRLIELAHTASGG